MPPIEGPPAAEPGPALGSTIPGPAIAPLPPLLPPAIGRSEPSLLTSKDRLRPPYPPQKLILEEEASLTLRLTIDERGRVVDVAPVGRADPAFFLAARRHLMAHWRYRPAMDNGRAVPATLTTTLHFRLDG